MAFNTLAILGGTFDPIHFGHLRMALELKQSLELDEMRLLPCNLPPHRPAPQADAKARLEMLRLALATQQDLLLDDREILRAGISYMVDTLQSYREEYGQELSLNLVLGMDAFSNLPSWHAWERIAQLAHLIVVTRPGAKLPEAGVMAHFLHAREVKSVAELRESGYGRVLVQPLAPLDISSTRIRALIAARRSPRYLLPDSVWDYIGQHQLYGAEQTL